MYNLYLMCKIHFILRFKERKYCLIYSALICLENNQQIPRQNNFKVGDIPHSRGGDTVDLQILQTQ